ncbi:putative C6 finger domain protein [Aspergillus germanicus]
MPDKKPITIACDACRRRKVKCNGLQPCNRCEGAGIACRTTSVRRKKGRQGATATVLQELRKAPARTAGPSFPPTGPSNEFVRQPRLLDPTVVQSCAEYFFARMLGTVPILLPRTFQDHVNRLDECPHSYCLVSAFCAFVFTQTGYASSLDLAHLSSTGTLGRQLLGEAMAARRHLDPFAAPTRVGITIAFLLYGCQIGLGNQRQAYYFLREATTLYTAGILDQADNGVDDDSGSLFWLLLISERAHAIRRHRPITLQVTHDSPVLHDAPTDAFRIGFRCLAELYRPFDQTFLSRWNGTDPSSSRELLIQLEEHLQQAVPADLELSDMLLADLRVSQQWLRTMIWQLATSSGFLSSAPSHPCLGFAYPLQIARDLSLATWKLSKESMETHGVGLVEKMFEITCTLTDVMACMSPTGIRSSSFDLGPQDYLKHLCTLIRALPGGETKFLSLLLAKIGQTLPSMLSLVTRHLGLPVQDAISPKEVDIGSPISLGNDWNKAFNWAEMSRIGDKTPEIEGGLEFGLGL